MLFCLATHTHRHTHTHTHTVAQCYSVWQSNNEIRVYSHTHTQWHKKWLTIRQWAAQQAKRLQTTLRTNCAPAPSAAARLPPSPHPFLPPDAFVVLCTRRRLMLLLLLCLNKLKQLRFVEQPTGNPDLKPNWQPFPAPLQLYPLERPSKANKSDNTAMHCLPYSLPTLSISSFSPPPQPPFRHCLTFELKASSGSPKHFSN